MHQYKYIKMESLKHRTSIRKYSSKEVPSQLITALLENAERTPTMGNLQLYSVIITRDKAIKKLLSPPHFNQPMVQNAPVVLTFCADYRRTSLWATQRQAQTGYNNFLSFLNAATDALLYCQTFCNIAEEAGLGTCFLGTTIYSPQPIIDILKLPKLVFPVATITLGWPDEAPALTDRLPIESIVHEETYRDYTPELINKFYTPKEALPENKHFVEVNNKQTLAQVITDIRYTREANEAMSKGLLEALYRQGFLSYHHEK